MYRYNLKYRLCWTTWYQLELVACKWYLIIARNSIIELYDSLDNLKKGRWDKNGKYGETQWPYSTAAEWAH